MVARITNLRIKDSGEIKTFQKLNLTFDIGILPEDANTPHHSGMTVGELAAVHEYGVGPIPARMWFRGWVAKYASRVTHEIRTQLVEIVRKQKFDAVSMAPLQVIAQRAQATMAGRIFGGQIEPKNKPSTLKKKKPENRPLVERGVFGRAIKAQVKVRGGGLLGAFRRGLSWDYKTGEGGK